MPDPAVGRTLRAPPLLAGDGVLLDSDLHRWRACPLRFWLQARADATGASDDVAPDPAADAGAEEAVVQGPGTGAALRGSFPGAATIAAPQCDADWEAAIARTRELLDEAADAPPGRTLLGACLDSDDGVRVRIDVLTRGRRAWRVLKVRYATVADEADVDAVALWMHVVLRRGLRVEAAALLLVDTAFVYPGLGCYAGLFREVDVAPMLGARPVATWLVAMRAGVRAPPPAVAMGPHCTRGGPCAWLAHCGAGQAEPSLQRELSVASLEIVGRELAAELRDEGFRTLRDVPMRRLADPRHRRALRAVIAAAPVCEPAVAASMRGHGYPRHTLRFETIGFAVPAWPGTQPYQVLPFQWTCDIEEAPGRLERRTFLADAHGDPRRAFAQALLGAIGREGPVYAYNAGFERNRLRELAARFEDLAEGIEGVSARLVDLLQLARAHYYHPAMRGSWSFRSVLGTIDPGLREAGFRFAGGASAQSAFARSLARGVDATTCAELRATLLHHGLRQVEALRRMEAVFDGADGALRP
jgi:hypothetical protein